jgi:small subunit ribosomal protein S20
MAGGIGDLGSAEKRHRQNEKRRLRNKKVKSRVKNMTKVFMQSLSEGSREKAEENFSKLESLIDRASSKGVFHKNTAARKKSQMNRLLQDMP